MIIRTFLKGIGKMPSSLAACALALILSASVTACSGSASTAPTASAASSESAAPTAPAASSESAVPPASSESAVPPASAASTSAAQESTAQASAFISITDMTGREIILDEAVTRIVALTPSDCEILYAIGAGDLIVGRGRYCDYPQQVLDIPAVASGSETNIEEIIDLEPQVLVMSTMAQTQEQIRMLEDAGIKVVVSDAQDIEGVYTAIELLGRLTGHQSEAEKLCSDMQESFSRLSSDAKAKADDRIRTVYFEVTPPAQGLYTAGTGTFMNEIAELLGLKNIFSDTEGWNKVSEEQVIERNPDYIVTIGGMSAESSQTPAEEIMSRPAWQSITAVRNKAILNVPDNEFSRPAPRLVDAAQALYDLVYAVR